MLDKVQPPRIFSAGRHSLRPDDDEKLVTHPLACPRERPFIHPIPQPLVYTHPEPAIILLRKPTISTLVAATLELHRRQAAS